MANVTLYDLQGCPYCAKVRRALEELDVEYETVSVPRSRNSREEVYEVSGQYGVPVLVDRENGIDGMPESDDIVRYLHEEYGDGDYELSRGLFSRLAEKLR